jgi:hypothetical protein
MINTGVIVDKTGITWSLATSTDRGMQIVMKGTVDAATANVTLLLYWNQIVYQQNAAGGWWLWNNGWSATTDPRLKPVVPVPPVVPPTVVAESVNGTKVIAPGEGIVDAALTLWTLVSSASSGLQISHSKVVDTATSNVTLLLYWNHQVYQQNAAGGWWYWTGSWVGTSDPRVTAGNTVTVNLSTKTGTPVPATLFGIGSSGDFNGNRHAISNNTSWQAAAKSLNMSLFRPNFGNSNVMANMFANQGSPDWSHIDTLLKNLPTFFDVANGRLLVTLGGDAPSWINIHSSVGQVQFADLCVQIAQRFANAGVECFYYELWNEPDSIDINTYCDMFNIASAALKKYGSSRGKTYNLGGVTDTWMRADRIKVLAEKCRPDFLSYHQYVTGPGDGSFQPGNLSDTPTVMQKAINNYKNAATDCRNAVAGTASANVPIFLGEWNIVYTPDSGGGNYNIDYRQITNIGAVFTALAFISLIDANKNVTMGALWELYADTFYGVVRTDLKISAQGALFQRLTTSMAGDQVKATVSGSMNLKCLAITNESKFGVMLVNYDTNKNYAVNLVITGLTSTTVNQYEVNADNLAGRSQSVNTNALGNLNLPAMSVTLITSG